MSKDQKISAFILEKDKEVIERISNILKEKSYDVTVSGSKAEAISLIQGKGIGLVILGDAEEENSIFDALKDIVMASPMASVILVTDLPDGDVHEKAEGYGILGGVSRDIPRNEFISLIENFERIAGLLP